MLKKILRALSTGKGEQNFIGHPAIPRLLQVAPVGMREGLARYVLSISPHYYAAGKEPAAEHERMRRTRRKLIEMVAGKYLSAKAVVLDFGCGPGYTTYELAQRAGKVYGADISTGALACARILNARPNAEFLDLSLGHPLSQYPGSQSIDLIFSTAVLQHVSAEQIRQIFREWKQILRPGGKVLCHIPLRDNRSVEQIQASTSNADGASALRLRFQFFSAAEMREFAENAGFRDVEFLEMRALGDIEDDVEGDHLMLVRQEA